MATRPLNSDEFKTYGTVTYTTTAGNEYSFTYATKENFQAAMKNIQAKRQEGKVTKAAFTPIRQPARARQSFFGKPISREEWLAKQAATSQECSRLWDCQCQDCTKDL